MTREIQKWADKAMYEAEPMDGIGPRVYLISATPDPLGAIAAASGMYQGHVYRDLSEVPDETRERAWEESLKTDLRAPHEFVDFHFMIEGVSRAFTHQLVRQRTAVYVQESLRFAVKDKIVESIPFPPSISADSEEAQLWDKALWSVEDSYQTLINMGVPAEDARGLLPHAITTRVHYKTNLRNLADHAGMRLCTQAQFEWREVYTALVRSIQYYSPPVKLSKVTGLAEGLSQAWQFERIAKSELFRPACFQKGHCPFKADFDRDCTIRERADRGEFDKIETSEWLFDPAAARSGS